MTTQEFKDAFVTRFYAEVGVDAVGWEDVEISEFLNFSQLSLVVNNARAGNLAAISNLITNTEPLTPASVGEGEFLASIKGLDFFYLLDGKATVAKQVFPVERIEPEHINTFKSNPYNTAFFRYPRAAQNGESSISILVSQGQSLEAITMRYVKKPVLINIEDGVTTNINEDLHNEIVEIAVRRAVEVIVKTGQSAQ